jgi:chemotaxis protein methyltransferase CheR
MGGLSNTRLLEIQQIAGADLSVFDYGFVDGVLSKRMAETACRSFSQYLELLKEDFKEVACFKSNLLVGHSLFFRNALTFTVLEKLVFPRLISKSETSGRGIRIWSSACAAGHEPYSLAMLLEELNELASDPFHFRIFASDISPSFLAEAQKAKYPPSSLKNVNYERLNKWFTEINGSFHIDHSLKKNIDFSLFDLLDKHLACPAPSIFGTFDMIVCANVLFYYQPMARKTILNKISKCLDRGGYLVTGETERDYLLAEGFNEAYPFSAIFTSKIIQYEPI